MSIEEIAVDLPAADAPPLVTEAFGNRTVFEMEFSHTFVPNTRNRK